MIKFLAPLSLLVIASCAPSRTSYSPDSPPTVGMPAEISERERLFIPDIDSALRREGLIPVGNGRGDLQLDFSIAEGPINTNTNIALFEGNQTLAFGKARAAGVPMIGRAGVAEKSFSAAFADFDASLSGIASRRGWSASSSFTGTQEYGYSDDQLPVY